MTEGQRGTNKIYCTTLTLTYLFFLKSTAVGLNTTIVVLPSLALQTYTQV